MNHDEFIGGIHLKLWDDYKKGNIKNELILTVFKYEEEMMNKLQKLIKKCEENGLEIEEVCDKCLKEGK